MSLIDESPVLVISGWDGDAEVDWVVAELRRRGIYVLRFDVAEFPQRMRLAAVPGTRWSGFLRTDYGEIALEQVQGVLCWRPTECTWPTEITDSERRFAAAEARLGLGGLLASLPCRWIGHPSRVADAEYKPLQLQTATRCGLRIPRTVLTNDSKEAVEFADRLDGPLVYKPLLSRAVAHQGHVRVVYTSVVDLRLEFAERIETTMHLFQEWVPKSYEVRCTVVGNQVFAAAIHAGSARSLVDWRADYEALEYTLVNVPDTVRAGVLDYLKTLELSFGAFDFVVTPEDKWVFLECNPVGMWSWIEECTEAPITTAIADLLTQGEAQ